MSNPLTAEDVIKFLFDKSTESEMRKMIRNLSTRHQELQSFMMQQQQAVTSVYKSISSDIKQLKDAVEVLNKKMDEIK